MFVRNSVHPDFRDNQLLFHLTWDFYIQSKRSSRVYNPILSPTSVFNIDDVP